MHQNIINSEGENHNISFKTTEYFSSNLRIELPSVCKNQPGLQANFYNFTKPNNFPSFNLKIEILKVTQI